MGYSFDMQGRLCCDNCGQSGQVRKRTCPHKVQYPGGGSLPYCSPAALCPACYKTHKATLHATCEASAAQRSAEYRAIYDRVQAGDPQVATAWGSWHPHVPEGFVGVCFRDRDRRDVYRLIADADYAQRQRPAAFLGDFAQAYPWAGPEGNTAES